MRLEGGDVDIFRVLLRFDMCIRRFRGCWGRPGCFGGVWNVMLGVFWGCWGRFMGCLGVLGHFGGCWTLIVNKPLQSVWI